MLYNWDKWICVALAVSVAAVSDISSTVKRDYCLQQGAYVSMKLIKVLSQARTSHTGGPSLLFLLFVYVFLSFQCMDTAKPCCQPAVLQDGHIRHFEHICFIFGQGLCQPLFKIPQMQLYIDLLKKLNSTNYMELRRVYRKLVDNCTTTELTDSRLLGLNPRAIPTRALKIRDLM